jgi:hypothetical protein
VVVLVALLVRTGPDVGGDDPRRHHGADDSQCDE